MKKIFTLMITGIICLTGLTGCKNETNEPEDLESYLGESVEDAQVFPVSDEGYVGDPMPYYEDGVFHVFYLLDSRDGNTGYHPWALYETSNFYEYENKGEVIPYADTIEEQDIALGTGSVIKDKNGLYHAFYTGHNDTYTPKEAVMHATSKDMLSWTKIPEDTFYAGETYSQDDFRDPYALYVEEEDQYWLIVTTRANNTGVLVKYTSKDLKTWKDEGIFFENDMGTDSNMECPSLIRYQGVWYLSFSDQWPARQFHYRVSSKINGPFEIPNQDVIDGNGFYAGRLESDGKTMYAFGWNGTKVSHSDSEDYDWAGNLVVHQLVQKEDGSLVPVMNTSIKKGMKEELSLKPLRMTETIKKENGKNNYDFHGKEYEVIEFKNMLGTYLIEASIKNFEDSERFGFAFNTDDKGVGNLNIVFDVKENKLKFYNTNELYVKDPQSELDFDFGKTKEIKISLLISDGVASMYVNDQCAFTVRMYSSQGMKWGIFGINSGIQCENVKIYK